jgi:hypothetical protein
MIFPIMGIKLDKLDYKLDKWKKITTVLGIYIFNNGLCAINFPIIQEENKEHKIFHKKNHYPIKGKKKENFF